ncbi:MAG: biotin attachment protein [Candidatus Schekmanbacteria bacterium RBG_16_38_11]|uniref:Biotin attachment protein n=3 Tax=Bacteria candidate phyla TaxID=1783234 RepID=A0A1F7RAD4_9BACT|nr:MAG: Pyruvate/2-oxoglutarate dehydrogenase complex, dihydrolipoamide acyltransferase component [Candidatus Gottesmanbacteria bacterium GW2011_GWC2_39_8]OGL38526.1 MAG: biotin attachment protein [Candidatus Schekmanbacteria bacterium GWA2_38_11]OGL45449.1 MAG: biotin attachment protein [Candidatus Schekmanbacteria bacterium RBG_16_38_11]
MSVDVVMPKLGLTMEEGSVVRWLKNEGDRVEKGEVILVVETEKVEYELESPASGMLKKIIGQVEQVYPVGEVMAVIEEG